MESYRRSKSSVYVYKTSWVSLCNGILVTSNTSKFLTPVPPLVKGKFDLGIGFSSPQLASFICQTNYPSSWDDTIPALGLEAIQWSQGQPEPCFHLPPSLPRSRDRLLVLWILLRASRCNFPQGACSFLENCHSIVSPVLQLHGITECTSSSKLTQSQS